MSSLIDPELLEVAIRGIRRDGLKGLGDEARRCGASPGDVAANLHRFFILAQRKSTDFEKEVELFEKKRKERRALRLESQRRDSEMKIYPGCRSHDLVRDEPRCVWICKIHHRVAVTDEQLKREHT